MSKKISKMGLVSLLLFTLALMSASAFGAEEYAVGFESHAVITGDGVRVRALPSIKGEIVAVLDKGARVYCDNITSFSDTIDGYTAPWYEVYHGNVAGYVFGKFVMFDPGWGLFSTDTDIVACFIHNGICRFGRTESEIVGNLGQPISRTEAKFENDIFFDTKETITRKELFYDGIVFNYVVLPDGRVLMDAVSYTTDSYVFAGLKVGSSIADVQRLLGFPTDIDQGGLLFYNDSLGSNTVSFRVRDGVVVEIIFSWTLVD